MSADTTKMLVAMGFTPSQSEAALIEADWVVDKALDILVRARSESKSQSPLMEKSHPAAESDVTKISQPSFAENAGNNAPTEDVAVNAKIVYETPDIEKAEQVNGEEDVQSKPDVEAPSVAEAVKDTNTDQTQGTPQDLVEFAQKPTSTNTGDSPSSNTKLKRTKSTKSRGRPKKSEAKVVEDEQQEVDELSASAVPEARAQDVSKTELPEVVVKTDRKPAKRPRDDKENSQTLPPPRRPDADAEIIEIDDDSDGPPKATKLRRMMTAPASVLKKEKKKRGRPGKKAKTEESEAKVEESMGISLAKEDVFAPGPSQVNEAETREVLKTLDKNAAQADQSSLRESVEQTIEPKDVSKKTKKAKASSKNVDTPRETPSRDTPQASVHEEDSVKQTAAEPKEASKKGKKTKANGKNVDTARETPSRETPQASENREEDTAERPSTPKTSDAGKSATKTTAKADEDTAMSKMDNTEKKKGGHSPIKNVIRTVNYRVGLSKRTKIEPLL